MSKIKIQDASVYKNQTNKQIVTRIKKIQELLSHFKVKAYAFDPGVACYYKINGLIIHETHMSFGDTEWRWLEPLLMELLEYRKEKNEK